MQQFPATQRIVRDQDSRSSMRLRPLTAIDLIAFHLLRLENSAECRR
jgi:hypothetical protein